MKRTLLLALVLIFCITGIVQAAPQVVLDGKSLSFEVPPTIENGRTMVPLRAIFEALGATVQWDDATKTVTATKSTTIIKLTIGSETALKNGESVPLDAPGMIVEGRTLVPLRFVSEALGAQVGWNGDTQTVSITSQASTPPAPVVTPPAPAPAVTTPDTTTPAPAPANPATVETPEEFALKVMKLSSELKWQELYDYIHPDIQALYTKEQYVAEREKNGKFYALVNKNYKTGTAVMLKEWNDKDGSKKTYTDVAAVPYEMTFNLLGEQKVSGDMHLAKAPDGSWKFFWWPKE